MNLRALLELMRISNLPTVWSNVFLGACVGEALMLTSQFDPQDSVDLFSHLQQSGYLPGFLFTVIVLSLGISMIYCGGMVLNDYWDRDIDARERPGRPIPSGRVTPRQAGWLAVGMLLLGFFFGGFWLDIAVLATGQELSFYHIPSLVSLVVLIGCVVLYNSIHDAQSFGVVVMGCCRSLAFLTPALYMCGWPFVNAFWVYIPGPAVTLLVYTLMISIVARREVEPGGFRKFGGPKTIMNMIAAMPLLDAVWLVAMGLWPASLVCVGCAALTKLGHRKVAGS